MSTFTHMPKQLHQPQLGLQETCTPVSKTMTTQQNKLFMDDVTITF